MRTTIGTLSPRGAVTVDRFAALDALGSETFDVLVVGGGITGVSVALDAAQRGLRTALVEANDFASGTSSASSKMIHGGLRYVAQKDFRLVIHSLKERQRLYDRAPHLVSRLPFLFPNYRTPASSRFAGIVAKLFGNALLAYDLLGGWRIGRIHQSLDAAEALTHCPTLKSEGLTGASLWFDTRTDDARLTMAVGRTAAAFGAHLVNHCPLTAIDPPSKPGAPRVARVSAELPDGTTRQIAVTARVIVNAAGVWTDEVDLMADPAYTARIKPAKGVHVVVPWHKVRAQSTLVFPMLTDARGKGGTGMAVRWGDYCYIGTTDTPFEGDYRDPRCERGEAQELLNSLNAALDAPDVTLSDITGSWAGLRPLIDTGGATSEVSRAHEITESDGVITVAGGKLTISRQMAQGAVDKACRILGTRRRCRTARTPILGGRRFDSESVEATGGTFGHLAGRYGTEARFVEDLAIADPGMALPIMDGLPYIWAEALFAIRHESAMTVADVLHRRIPARLFDSAAAAAAAEQVADLLGREVGTARAVLDRQVADFVSDVERERAEFRA